MQNKSGEAPKITVGTFPKKVLVKRKRLRVDRLTAKRFRLEARATNDFDATFEQVIGQYSKQLTC